ncbi:MAG: peptidylprolyl isomerase [Acidiferrobacterales bacterium]
MQITKHKAVTIDYTLMQEDGTVIQSTKDKEPLSYIHGATTILAALESALEGRSKGETFTVAIPPEQAYGERDESLVDIVPRGQLQTQTEDLEEIKVGRSFQATTATGKRVLTVLKIDGDAVTIDANHPLAGTTLVFAIAILDVRDATSNEIADGQVHDQSGQNQ